MKSCHHCATEFPSGLTCPSCHAFVPDAAPDDPVEPAAFRSDEPADEPAEPPADLPIAEAHGFARPDPRARGGRPRVPAMPTDTDDLLPAPPSKPAAPSTIDEHLSVSEAAPPSTEVGLDPEHGPDPEIDRGADRLDHVDPPEEHAPEPAAFPRWAVAADSTATTSEPPAPTFPSWARVVDTEADTADEVAPPPPMVPDWTRAPLPATTAGGAAVSVPTWGSASDPAAPGGWGVAPSGPDTAVAKKPAAFSLTPATLAFGIAALLVILIAGFLVLRPSTGASSASDVAPDIAGSCFVYTADRAQIDHRVPCDAPHDGTVLAYASDRGACPAGTDAILTIQGDANGRLGVLCVRERA